MHNVLGRLPRTINRPATATHATCTPLRIRMKCLFVVYGDLFAGFNVSQSEKEHVAVERAHERVRLA